MPSHAVLCLVIWLVGASVCFAVGPRARPVWCCAASFPVGLAIMVMVSLAVLAARLPYTWPVVLGVALAVIVAGGLIAGRAGALDARALRVSAAWAAGVVVVACVLAFRNYSVLSFDSHYMVMLGQSIHDDHALVPGMLTRLSEYGVFQILEQSWAGFVHARYLYALSPALGVATIALFAVSLWHGVEVLGAGRRGRALLIGLLAFSTFTIYMVFHHFFYIHTNFGTGVYIFLFAAGAWLAETQRDARWLVIAVIGLTAVALHRIENPLVCVVLLVLTVPQSKLPARPVLAALAGYAIVVTGWYGLLGLDAPETSQFLTPKRCLVFIAFNLIAVAYAALSLRRWPWLVRLNRAVPVLLLVGVLVGIAVAFVADAKHMATSYLWWKNNLMFSTFWEQTWWAVALLWIVSVFAPRVPFAQVFSYGAPIYFAMILLLGSGRAPYREGMGDSAARMAVHLVPMAFFYLGLVFLPLVLKREPAPVLETPS